MKVVDASVAVKWVFDEPGSRSARELLAVEPSLTAPRLWLVESVNVLGRKAAEGKLSVSDVVDRAAFLRRLPIEAVDDASLLDAALGLALELRHPLYDCLYLALALALDRASTLVTADERFAEAARRGGYSDRVELIGPDRP